MNPVPVGGVSSLQPGDQVRLRKPHPCGGREWQVTRIGAETGLSCLTCGRVVLLPREEFDRRCIAHQSAAADTNTPAEIKPYADPASPA